MMILRLQKNEEGIHLQLLYPKREIQFLYLLFFPFQTELSHNLQQLSEKARSTTEFIHRLKGMSDKVTVSAFCTLKLFEAFVVLLLNYL